MHRVDVTPQAQTRTRRAFEADHIAELQLPAPATIDLTVDGDVTVDDRLFHVAARVEQARELEELTEADAVSADRDVGDRCRGRHSGMLTGHAVRMRSAHFSPIIMTVMLGFTVVISGITDASATRRPVTPFTRSCGSTGDIASSTAPIRAVPTGW